MPLTSTAANKMTNSINQAFDAIGRKGDSEMPHSTRNTEQVAWEFHVASHLYRIAEGRKKVAVKAAINAGILPDYEKEPSTPGTNMSVYHGDVVQVSLKVNNGKSYLDHKSFSAALIKHGVDSDLVNKLLSEHTKNARAPHQLTTALVVAAGN